MENEVPLAPGALVRFGDVQTLFEPTDDSVAAQQGGSTRVVQAMPEAPAPSPAGADRARGGTVPTMDAGGEAPPPTPVQRPAPARRPPPPVEAEGMSGMTKVLIGVVVVIVLIFVALLLAG